MSNPRTLRSTLLDPRDVFQGRFSLSELSGRQIDPVKIPLDWPVSKNFTVREVFASDTAKRKNIRNFPLNASLFNSAITHSKELAVNVLQPIRDHYGPVTITSWHRSPALNRELKGNKSSAHLFTYAADFVIQDVDLFDVFCWIVNESNIEFDQAIYERRILQPSERRPYRSFVVWIHIATKGDVGNRKEALLSLEDGKYKQYEYGDQAI